MKAPIINLDQLEPKPPPFPAPERYGARLALIAPLIGAQKLGYNLTVIEPGKVAFPLHNHWANEELFLVLEGEGEVRIGEARFPLRKGDVIACPPGGPDTAHQIVNTSKSQMRIFAVSTKITPEVCDYPDSGKFGILAAGPTGPGGQERTLRFISRENLSLDYYEGE